MEEMPAKMVIYGDLGDDFYGDDGNFHIVIFVWECLCCLTGTGF